MWTWLNENANTIIAISSTLSLLSLLLIFWQIYSARKWNKLHFTYTFFPNSLEFDELESFLDNVIRFWKRDEPLEEVEVKALVCPENLTDKELQQIIENFSGKIKNEDDPQKVLIEANRKLKIYLNQIEAYCAAIQTGIIDSEAAKMLFGYKFKRSFNKAKPWIDKLRTIKNEPSLYIEIENVLKKWFPEKSQKKRFRWP